MENTAFWVGLTAVAIVGFAWYKKKASASKPFLDPTRKQSVTLIEKEIISHDVRRFRFALPNKSQALGLPIGKHMYISASINGTYTARTYTPVSSDNDLGYFDLVIKVYFAGVHPKFPEGGQMSQYLEKMNIGDTIDVRGPVGHITYPEPGLFEVKEKGKSQLVRKRAKRVGMIAGGTGITPMLQIIRHALKTASDDTEFFLLFANQTEEDILLRKELDADAEKYSRMKVWYTVDRAPKSGWKYSEGFVSKDMIQKHLPPAGPDTVICLCGPPPMIKFACLPNLKELGFNDDQILVF